VGCLAKRSGMGVWEGLLGHSNNLAAIGPKPRRMPQRDEKQAEMAPEVATPTFHQEKDSSLNCTPHFFAVTCKLCRIP